MKRVSPAAPARPLRLALAPRAVAGLGGATAGGRGADDGTADGEAGDREEPAAVRGPTRHCRLEVPTGEVVIILVVHCFLPWNAVMQLSSRPTADPWMTRPTAELRVSSRGGRIDPVRCRHGWVGDRRTIGDAGSPALETSRRVLRSLTLHRRTVSRDGPGKEGWRNRHGEVSPWSASSRPPLSTNVQVTTHHLTGSVSMPNAHLVTASLRALLVRALLHRGAYTTSTWAPAFPAARSCASEGLVSNRDLRGAPGQRLIARPPGTDVGGAGSRMERCCWIDSPRPGPPSLRPARGTPNGTCWRPRWPTPGPATWR